jgi:type I restriction enzyme S subunit
MKKIKIKDICIKGSSNLKQKEVEKSNGKYPVFGASGIVGYINTFHQDKNYIGIIKDGSGIGRVNFYPAKSSVLGTIQYILPKDGYDIKYIGYCLKSLDLSKYKQGAAIPHIYFRDYGERLIRVEDDIKKQQHIVSYLDTTFAKIDAIAKNAEDSLNEAKALFQAKLKEMLEKKDGWEEKTLDDLSENLDYKRIPVTLNKREKGKYPYYGASGIVDYVEDYLFDGDYLLVSEDGANLLARTTPIAFSVTGKIWVNNHAHILKFHNLITQKFIEYYFAFINIKDYITGAAQPKLTQRNLYKIPFAIPPLNIQNSILSSLDQIKEKLYDFSSHYTHILTDCNALKQSILRQTFE